MALKIFANEKGIALIITIMITAVLVAVVTEIVYMVHMHTFMAASFRDGQRAEVLAEGGVEVAKQAIAATIRNKDYTYFRPGETLGALSEDDGVMTVRGEDEQGKFQINSIVYADGEINVENYSAYLRLLKVLDLERGLADSLADWIDANDQPRPNGAETRDYYNKLAQPYTAKNGPLETVDELLLCRGYTPEVRSRLLRYITVYTDGKININSAPEEVIMALSDEISAEMAQRVVNYRKKKPFIDTAEVRKISGFATLGFALQEKITVKSGVFKIHSTGEAGEAISEVEAVLDVGKGGKLYYWRAR